MRDTLYNCPLDIYLDIFDYIHDSSHLRCICQRFNEIWINYMIYSYLTKYEYAECLSYFAPIKPLDIDHDKYGKKFALYVLYIYRIGASTFSQLLKENPYNISTTKLGTYINTFMDNAKWDHRNIYRHPRYIKNYWTALSYRGQYNWNQSYDLLNFFIKCDAKFIQIIPQEYVSNDILLMEFLKLNPLILEYIYIDPAKYNHNMLLDIDPMVYRWLPRHLQMQKTSITHDLSNLCHVPVDFRISPEFIKTILTISPIIDKKYCIGDDYLINFLTKRNLNLLDVINVATVKHYKHKIHFTSVYQKMNPFVLCTIFNEQLTHPYNYCKSCDYNTYGCDEYAFYKSCTIKYSPDVHHKSPKNKYTVTHNGHLYCMDLIEYLQNYCGCKITPRRYKQRTAYIFF